MSEQFKNQDEVAIRGVDVPFPRVTFISYSGDQAIVEINKWGRKQLNYFNRSDVISVSEAEAEEVKAEAERDRLKDELEVARATVAKKMTEATNALKEANSIASKLRVSLADEFYDETRGFLNALDDAGWSSSSLNC